VLAVVRFPIVAFAFVLDRLRRLPGAGYVDRRAAPIAVLLMLAALAALAVQMAQRSPQRISLADLAAGKLSPMQSWIIVSGELSPELSNNPQRYRYTLRDPATPNARLIVFSPVELPTGHTTVSGTVAGGQVPAGYAWTGTLSAEPELAQEEPPPWLAYGFAAAGLLLAASSRIRYPVFFRERPAPSALRRITVPVSVRRAEAAATSDPATLELQPGAAVELRFADGAVWPLRLHSAHTGADAGALSNIRRSQPALLVHHPNDELTLTFTSYAERDLAYAALTADVAGAAAAG
jgi:hypothetical protein